jgi:hypothetical protein
LGPIAWGDALLTLGGYATIAGQVLFGCGDSKESAGCQNTAPVVTAPPTDASGAGSLDLGGVAGDPNQYDPDDDDEDDGRIPNTNPDWGVNRLTKELYGRGYKFEGMTRSGGGRIYRNPATGEEVRIMPRPNREPFRTESPEKFSGDYYYRYRPNPNLPEGPHVSIPPK